MPNNAYIFSVNLPSELIPNSFFYVEYPSHYVTLSCMFCLFIFWFNIFQKQEFGLIFVKVKGLDNG